MLPKTLLSLRKPLFFKLAAVFMTTSLAVLSAVAAYLFVPHGPPRGREGMRNNMLFHVNDLADRIGMPPDHSKAAALASQLGLKIRIEGPELPWSSAEGMAATEIYEAALKDEKPGGIRLGRLDGSFTILMPRGHYRFLFVFPGSPDPSVPLRASLLLVGMLILILILSYYAVSWLLKPLGGLVTGVNEISAGNLKYRVDLGAGQDEFRSLAGSFNQMADKVREMLQSKERLLLDVSHELRSPLSRIKVALALIPNSVHKKSISKAASDMEVMLSEILETERLKSSHGSLAKKPLILSELAAGLVGEFKGQKPGLKFHKPKSFPVLDLDESKVAMVLKNVIGNSMKYSQEQRKKVELRFELEKGWARVKVKDYGIGIPKEELGKVFEPFYRVDKSRSKNTGGYGLGLSLCKEIMQAHKGQISLASKAGSGTEVTLSFPRP